MSCFCYSMVPCLLQDSPNIRSILSSKATGEPSLMLSSSVLYALRRAVVEARNSLPAPAQPLSPTLAAGAQAPPASHRGSSVGSSTRGVAAGAEFLILEAPATTAHLKEAIGGFSIADILQVGMTVAVLPSQLFVDVARCTQFAVSCRRLLACPFKGRPWTASTQGSGCWCAEQGRPQGLNSFPGAFHACTALVPTTSLATSLAKMYDFEHFFC